MRNVFSGVLGALAGRLTVRLLVLMSVALLPLGVIAVMTSANAIRAADEAAEQSLIGLTAQAVSGKRALIESAFAAASALAGVTTETRANPEDCDAFLSQYISRSGLFSFAGFISTDGELECRSGGADANFAGAPAFTSLVENPGPIVTSNPVGVVTGLPVVIASQPVFADGVLQGFMTVSLTTRSLELLGRRMGRNAPESLIMFNQRGQIISASSTDQAVTLTLPDGLSLADLPRRAGEVFRGSSHDGQTAFHAVAELLPNRLYVVGQWSNTAPAVEMLQTRILPLILPVMMWLASLGVAFLAVYFLVLRQLRVLNRQMRRFALGQREAWEDLPTDASAEFREINATFRRMARIIARDEAEREDALAEKTVLLKEIHHRVKNNLQLIASIINLQIRELSDESSRAVLQNVQNRVLSMAAIHRSLYEEQRLTDLRADRVLGEIVQRLVSFGTSPAQEVDISCRFAPLTLSAERMVPLSLLLTEVLTNAIKHRSQPGNDNMPWIEVSMEPAMDSLAGHEIVLQVSNSSVGEMAPEPELEPDPEAVGVGYGIGADLIEAFAAQMDAEVTRSHADTPRGPAWIISLRFQADQPAEAETGTAPVAIGSDKPAMPRAPHSPSGVPGS
jgi:two-component sensor histidine kinase